MTTAQTINNTVTNDFVLCGYCGNYHLVGTSCNLKVTFPCLGSGFHDYAVGKTRAICNRCSIIVNLDPEPDQ